MWHEAATFDRIKRIRRRTGAQHDFLPAKSKGEILTTKHTKHTKADTK